MANDTQLALRMPQTMLDALQAESDATYAGSASVIARIAIAEYLQKKGRLLQVADDAAQAHQEIRKRAATRATGRRAPRPPRDG